jgi:hypothetical protein
MIAMDYKMYPMEDGVIVIVNVVSAVVPLLLRYRRR